MRFQRKVQIIDAYTFPIEVEVSQPTIPDSRVHVPAGDYLLIVDGALGSMTKKQFHAAHDPVELAETRESVPRVRKTRKNKPRGLKAGVLEQPQTQQTNGVEQQA